MSGASRTTTSRAASQTRALDTSPVTHIGLVGVTERGPYVPTEITSYPEYQRLYGGPTLNSQAMDLAVLNLFAEAVPENGKPAQCVLHIARVCHYSDATDATTKASAAGSVTLVDRAGTPLSTLKIDGKSDGSYTAALTIQIAAPSNGATGAFNLYVLRSGIAVERYYNLTMVSSSPDYVVTAVNSGAGSQLASNLITVTDLASATASPSNIPAIATSNAMSGGSDGLASIADADYTGASGTNGPTGMRLLDSVETLHVLLVPGRATSTTVNAQVTYCETIRGGKCFTIIEPPAGLTCSAMRTFWNATASLKGLSQMFAGYYPRVLVDNPNATVFGQAATLTMAPGAQIAGLYARMDASKEGGAFEQPASIEQGYLRTVRGLESTTDVYDETKRGLLQDDLINPIMMRRTGRAWVDGAATASVNGPFPSVGESRGVLFVQYEVANAVDPKRNQNNRPRLRNEIKMTVEPFMSRLTSKGCFASTDDAEAWYFDIGEALNSAAEQKAQNVNARLGIATTGPGKYINIVFGKK